MPKTANAYMKIIVVSDMKRAVNDFTSAHPKIAAFAKGVAKAGLIAGAAIGALVATFYVLKKALTMTLGAYVDYGKKLLGLTRISGITGRAVQNLSAQFQMSGVDAAKAQTSMGLFAKKLDAARQGTKAALVPFQRLGVHIRDAEGALRPTGEVLAEVRDRLSEVKDSTTRAGIAAALFGRGFQTLGAWITKSRKDIVRYNKIVAESGVTWGGKQVRGMKQFIDAQREMGLRWDLFRVNLGQKIMPMANKFMRSMSKWMGDKKNQKAMEDLAESLGTIAVALGEIASKIGIVNDRFERFGKFGEFIKGFVLPFAGLKTILEGPDTSKQEDKLAKLQDHLKKLRENLAKRLSMGYFENKKLLRQIAGTQKDIAILRATAAAPMAVGHLNTSGWTGPIARARAAFEAWKSVSSTGWSTGRLNVPKGDYSEGIADTGGAGYGWASKLARQFGNVVTSTYRPGAITASGNVSDHGTYGRAADLADGLGNMARLWNYVKSTAGSWKQAIYQHQMISYGKLGTYGPGDHFDHVHLARRSMGGVVKRAEMALIGESGAEAIIPLTKPRRARQVMQQAGLAGFGSGTINVNVVVPGGTTLIGTAQEVGNILAPHVARALTRSGDRAARRR